MSRSRRVTMENDVTMQETVAHVSAEISRMSALLRLEAAVSQQIIDQFHRILRAQPMEHRSAHSESDLNVA